jgi:hypothetical protein
LTSRAARASPAPIERRCETTATSNAAPATAFTGFNPAFYNAPTLSPQQQLRNLEPHLVYLAHFGGSTMKVGMTHARRGIHRLLEQGARMGVLLARFADAYRARALEERIARDLEIAEAVRPARKRQLLGAPFSSSAVGAELHACVEQIRALEPGVPLEPELVELDRTTAALPCSTAPSRT